MPKKKYTTPELDINGLFDTDEDRKSGISSFMNLKNTNGWNLISQILKNQIELLTDKILAGDNGGGKSAEEKLYIRDRMITQRKELEGILKLPDYIIETLKDNTKTDFGLEELDPYEQLVDNPL